MTIRKVSMLFCAVFAIGLVAFAADEKKFKASCPVSGGPAKEDKTVAYKDAKVYFCCEKCPVAFEKDVAKFATKANKQLVETGQATQAKCPLTGGKLNPDATVMIGDAKVQFCCNNCQKKVADATGDDQLKLVFSDDAFKKGFEVKKAEKK